MAQAQSPEPAQSVAYQASIFIHHLRVCPECCWLNAGTMTTAWHLQSRASPVDALLARVAFLAPGDGVPRVCFAFLAPGDGVPRLLAFCSAVGGSGVEAWRTLCFKRGLSPQRAQELSKPTSVSVPLGTLGLLSLSWSR